MHSSRDQDFKMRSAGLKRLTLLIVLLLLIISQVHSQASLPRCFSNCDQNDFTCTLNCSHNIDLISCITTCVNIDVECKGSRSAGGAPQPQL
ncbi:hypothetical protein SLEP1_g48294 [Rubroshorea leprosula]|uniref:Uncharacterized protein n=1 Tax=Rubroshorea leprosula TaxID=152421 RepID=A0AAV5LT59_9ROSI|nr:hypothetical protein SLEP1_g48294 [Rubroshorea leprosula]